MGCQCSTATVVRISPEDTESRLRSCSLDKAISVSPAPVSGSSCSTGAISAGAASWEKIGSTTSTVSTLATDSGEKKCVDDMTSAYSIDEMIGSGSYANVFKATQQSSGKEVAMKVIRPRSSTKDLNVDACQREIDIMQMIKGCDFVVEIQEHFLDSRVCLMALQYCQLDLFSVLLSHNVTERLLSPMFLDTLCGLEYVHSLDIVHRDLKPDNLLIMKLPHNEATTSNLGMRVMLADFGLAVKLPEGKKATGVYGTAPYMCPEMLAPAPYDQKADMWSVGVIMYTLLTGRFPHVPSQHSSTGMKSAIKAGPTLGFDEANRSMLSNAAMDFTTSLLKRDPTKRKDASEALQSKFLHCPETCSSRSLRRQIRSAVAMGALRRCSVATTPTVSRTVTLQDDTSKDLIPVPAH